MAWAAGCDLFAPFAVASFPVQREDEGVSLALLEIVQKTCVI